jgi:UDPglucose--hexose-1-phosphate uridylyltransferase
LSDSSFSDRSFPDLRRDPITGRWVIISAERAQRPTDFIRERVTFKSGFCPFCLGNEAKTPPEILAYRPGQNGESNVPGWTVRVVPNKFPALRVEGDLDRQADGIYDRMNGVGAHEVIIETPEHLHTFGTMPEKRIEDVLYAYRDRLVDLRKDHRLKYVLIFKNHGEAAGATLEHPHSQVIALPIVPRVIVEELKGAREYFHIKDRCIYCDIVRQEAKDDVRVVFENDSFIVVTPYASRFPFETWILPRKHDSGYQFAPPMNFGDLSRAMKQTFMKLDRVLDSPAYNMVLHSAPVQDEPTEHYHWHMEIMPKLTKVAGFEWGTGVYMNPTSPEEAAKYLREAKVNA